MTPADFRQKLEAATGVHAKLDVVFQTFDQLHYDGHFGASDTLLHFLDPVSLGEDLTVGVLCITLPAQKHLSERPSFLLRAAEVYPKDMLKGL